MEFEIFTAEAATEKQIKDFVKDIKAIAKKRNVKLHTAKKDKDGDVCVTIDVHDGVVCDVEIPVKNLLYDVRNHDNCDCEEEAFDACPVCNPDQE